MKSFILTMFICLVLLGQIYTQNGEEQAIINIIEQETRDFSVMSVADLVQKYWLIDDKTIKNVSLNDGTMVQSTAADMLTETAVPPPGNTVVQGSNYRICIQGKTAYATYDQEVSIEGGGKFYTREIRILNKIDSIWKIHIASIQEYKPKN